jgi:very-short-patch-repair endonuclease
LKPGFLRAAAQPSGRCRLAVAALHVRSFVQPLEGTRRAESLSRGERFGVARPGAAVGLRWSGARSAPRRSVTRGEALSSSASRRPMRQQAACHRSCALGSRSPPATPGLGGTHVRSPTSSASPSGVPRRALRARKLGVEVRRQVVLGDFIADFVLPSARLVIEIDGGYHRTRTGADARRDRTLARLGYRVVRIDAALVVRALPEALARVRDALRG